jgi:hypothetical protein
VTLYVAVKEPWEAEQVQNRGNVYEHGTNINPGLITTHLFRQRAALVAKDIRELNVKGLPPRKVIQWLLLVCHIHNPALCGTRMPCHAVAKRGALGL